MIGKVVQLDRTQASGQGKVDRTVNWENPVVLQLTLGATISNRTRALRERATAPMAQMQTKRRATRKAGKTS